MNDNDSLEREADNYETIGYKQVSKPNQNVMKTQFQKPSMSSFEQQTNTMEETIIKTVKLNNPVIQMVFDPNNQLSWERPEWDDGKKEDLWVRQTKLKAVTVDYGDEYETTSVMTICPICKEALSYQGASIDHIQDWKQYAATYYRPQNLAQLKIAFNDSANLILVHSSCNSAKGRKSVTEFISAGYQPNKRATWGLDSDSIELASEVERTINLYLNFMTRIVKPYVLLTNSQKC